jgi:hypothetical protein
METDLLLVKADYKDYVDLAESLDVDRTRLRPVLTGHLYTELLRLVVVERAAADTDSPAPLTGIWQELRNQSIAVVACASMVRYTPFSQTTATSNSMVRKTSQYSEPTDSRDLAR